MKKLIPLFSLFLVASSALLAQSAGPGAVPATPPRHLEATYSSSPDATITWTADLQNAQPPYQYYTTVTIQNKTTVPFNGWTLGLTGPWTDVAINNPTGEAAPSFVILGYQVFDFDTQQFTQPAYSVGLTETSHCNFISGIPNQGSFITSIIFGGNAFRPSTLSNTVNLGAGASVTFSYTAELPISQKLVVAVPPQLQLAYSMPKTIVATPDQTSN
ncbi:MAG: hypothetical protein FJ390_05845 [Verrucomicrobia bacterium]|nr:hypothetical protein [Verrucomicrobiota bacterium]